MDQKVAIEVENLCKTYGKGNQAVEAVKGISLMIARSEVFGFLGPNGADKTTSLRIMVGLSESTSGTVKILGKDPKDRKTADELKKKSASFPRKFPFTVT
ncbi:MAG: ATP-binding cassette domain-containing protein [Candidatus Odinarchaeota archaeon]